VGAASSLAAFAVAAAQLRELAESAPLAVERLWHRDPPRTSQREAARIALRRDGFATLVVGGNRAGKTRLGAAIAVACALGRNHPMVRAWARLNGLDVSTIPRGPGRVCVSSLSWSESIRVTRPAVSRLLPPGCRWIGGGPDTRGEVRVVTPNGGAILFKCEEQYKQDRQAFEGDTWDLLWIDEEQAEGLYLAGLMRVADRRGRVLLTMTPLKGRTWVWKRFIAEQEDGTAYYQVHGFDNPFVPRDFLERLLRSYSAAERAARERGEFTALEGRVYPAFERRLHVVDPRPIPADWPRFMGIDFGARNPFAALSAAIDNLGRLHVYREHYQAQRPISWHALAMLRAESCPACWRDEGFGSAEWWDRYGWVRDDSGRWAPCRRCRGTGRAEPEPEVRWADSAGRQERIELAEYGLPTAPSIKDVRAAIGLVSALLDPEQPGGPHLLIHSTCRHLVEELENYVWADSRSVNDPPEKPRKRDDHAVDALHYLVLGARRYGYLAE